LARQSPAAVVASAATPKERVLIATLQTVAAEALAHKFEPPAIVAVGDIVNFRERLMGAKTSKVKS
jgi:uroporphyrin-III C-methyltransferase